MPDASPPTKKRAPADDLRRPGRVKLVIGFFSLLGCVALSGATLAGSFWLFANDAWGGVSLLVALVAHIPTIALFNQALTAPPNATMFGLPRWLWLGLLTLLYIAGAAVVVAARLQ